MVRRRRTAEDQKGHDGHGGGALRWLLTYADMITLLMAFFIILYSMSVLNLNRFKEVAVSIRSGFGGDAQGQGKTVIGSPNPEGADSLKIPPDIPRKTIKKLQQFVAKEKLNNEVRFREDERGLVISLVTDKVLFERGKADLSPSARRIIVVIADNLKEIPNNIRIEGHTCNLPIVSEMYPSNWELSTARATNVVRFLIERAGIPASRLSAAGYADSKPLVPNNSEKNRVINRRVDMIILRGKAQDNER